MFKTCKAMGFSNYLSFWLWVHLAGLSLIGEIILIFIGARGGGVSLLSSMKNKLHAYRWVKKT